MSNATSVLSFGSLNLDYVYTVENIVRGGETIGSMAYSEGFGGKGANQSFALAQAGAEHVYHAGKVGKDGDAIVEHVRSAGVDVSLVTKVPDEYTGRAIIQVSTTDGENAIILYPGANHLIDASFISSTFNRHGAIRDRLKLTQRPVLLVQNEISNLELVVSTARSLGYVIILNATPITSTFTSSGSMLDSVDFLIVNKHEAVALMKRRGDAEERQFEESPVEAAAEFRRMFPRSSLLVTLGARGGVFIWKGSDEVVAFKAEEVGSIVDTTGAGDTFTGYFIASMINENLVDALGGEANDGMNDGVQRRTLSAFRRALNVASTAAAICVGRPGAMSSIPKMEEKEGAGQANWGIPGEELQVDLDQEENVREEHLKGDMIREGTTVKTVGEKEFRAAKEAMNGK
ncbi:hypothetical protein HK101_001956 [Irineochytrium annulatum]|nr:hypothetical protein HK101_001956 [Irineochytrium annulatum]